jgi:hypothetical protein
MMIDLYKTNKNIFPISLNRTGSFSPVNDVPGSRRGKAP